MGSTRHEKRRKDLLKLNQETIMLKIFIASIRRALMGEAKAGRALP